MQLASHEIAVLEILKEANGWVLSSEVYRRFKKKILRGVPPTRMLGVVQTGERTLKELVSKGLVCSEGDRHSLTAKGREVTL